MGAVWVWARVDLRRRWRAVVVLAVLLGMAGGFALAALVGARRASTAWDRLRRETLAPDAFVSIPSRSDAAVADELRSLPGVAEAAGFVFVPVAPRGMTDAGSFAAVDDRLGRSIYRWRVVEGRQADPDRPEEITVNPAMAEAADLGAGDAVTLAAPDGSFSVEAIVVGVVVGTLDLSQNVGSPGAYLTPAFLARYSGEVDVGRQNTFVHLTRGIAGVPAFRVAVAARFGEGGGVLVGDSQEDDGSIRRALRLQAGSLALVAAAAAAATLVALGQALSRHVATGADAGGALEALGMTRTQRFACALPTVALVAGVGTALAVMVAVAASPLVPPGLAGQVESSREISNDLVALAGGGTLLAAMVGTVGASASWRVARRTRRGAAARPARGLAGWVGPAAAVGLANATGGGTARSRAAAHSAIVAAVVGVSAVAATTTFAASLDHLRSTPRLFGWDFDALVGLESEDPARVDAAAETLARDPDVTRVAVADVVFLSLGGENVDALVIDQRKGKPIHPTIVAGHSPEAAGEIALGSQTMTRLGVRVGSTVEAVGTANPVALTVVSRAVFPSLGDGRIDDAASLTPAAAAQLRQEESRGRFVMVAVDPGTDPLAVAARHTDLPVSAPWPWPDVANLARVGSAPWLLAAFLGAVAVAAVGHALVLSVRAGRRELAVLRATGFQRAQVRATVIWQATAIMGIGLVVGLPLGVAIGRWMWTAVAGGTGVVVQPVVAVALLATMVPVALVLANAIAALPARAAARTSPALVLRTE